MCAHYARGTPTTGERQTSRPLFGVVRVRSKVRSKHADGALARDSLTVHGVQTAGGGRGRALAEPSFVIRCAGPRRPRDY